MKRKVGSSSGSGDIGEECSSGNVSDDNNNNINYNNIPEPISIVPIEFDLNDLPWDPADRKKIMEYHPNQRDEVRRKYWIRGPCQPRGQVFPRRMIGNKGRRFCPAWFYKYSNWLEYSVKVDKAFCLCCYLFRDQSGKQGGSDPFMTEGFHSWNKTEKFGAHIGDVNSFHNKALRKCDDLVRQDQSIVASLQKQSYAEADEYQMPIPSSQTDADVVDCISQDVRKPIFEEIGENVFGLLVDESSDVSKKENIEVVFRYVDTCGIVKERFLGLVHVMEKSASSLKADIESLFAENGLSIEKIRSQGYDGASNMRDEFNDLKALIMKENSSAYYVHCFAHPLELVVVKVAKKHFGVGNFFDMITVLMNVVCASCKQKDMVRESLKEKVLEEIGSGEADTGRELNQELSIIRFGDTSLGRHYKTLLHLVDLFPSVIEVLEYVEKEGDNDLSRRQAYGLQIYFKSFDFVFYLHLMLHILGLTDLLSQSLQRKDQDILNTISLVKSTKRQLQKFRADGFDSLSKKIFSFCEKHEIEILNMKGDYVNPKNRRQKTNITYGHHFEFDCFNIVVDMQIQEFVDRFNEVSSELLICMAALNPRDSFRDFDPSKLLRLTELYPDDFSCVERMTLEHQLNLYVDNMQEDERFADLNGITELARVIVETRKHLSHPLLFRLLKLVLLLPVATATIER